MASAWWLSAVGIRSGVRNKIIPLAVGTRSGRCREQEARPLQEGLRITNCYCILVVSIPLGEMMTRSWCQLVISIRSGAKITSGWSHQAVALVREACAGAARGSNDRKRLVHTAVSIHLGARMTSGRCQPAVCICSESRMTSSSRNPMFLAFVRAACDSVKREPSPPPIHRGSKDHK